jgi:hypothetical protein
MFVPVSTERVMMCSAIGNPANCEICAVICFFHTKNVSPAQVFRELCAVYGQNVMNEGNVRLV